MADATAPAPGAQGAPPAAATPAAPAKVDVRAEAFKVLNGEAAQADPKAPSSTGAPGTASTGDSGTSPAPTTASEPAADPALTPEALKQQQAQLARGFGKLATEKAAVLAREQGAKLVIEDATRWKDLSKRATTDPTVVLELLGSDPAAALELLAEAYITKRDGAKPASTEDRVAQLEAEREAERTAARDQQTKDAEKTEVETRNASISAAIAAVKDRIEASADKYPVISTKGEHDQVFTAVREYVTKHQIPNDQVTMDLVDTIAAAYEEARQTQLDEEISTLGSKVPRIAARLAPARKEPAPNGDPDAGAQASSVTLANSVVSEAPPPQPRRGYTKEELRAKALALFPKVSAPS